MNITCSICKDQMIQSDDIFHTACSHVFHFGCLTQWLERSQTCPQCREKVTKDKINRLFFTFSSNEVVSNASFSTVEARMKDLEFKILLKEKDIQYYTSKTVTLEKQNAGLRNEVYKVESEINKQNSMIYELKEEMKYCDDMKKEIAQLKSTIEKLRPIEMLLHGPIGDVREMVKQTTDPDVLLKYISVMKKMLTESSHKKKELRMTLKRLQEELARVNTKRASLLDERVELQEKLALAEGKNMSLQQRVDELEELLGINENCNQVTKPRNIEAKNNISKRTSLEGGIEREKYSQESPSKSPTYTKQRKGKICITKDGTSQAENDLFASEMDLKSSSSSSGFATSAKRAKLSNSDRSVLNKSETSKSTQFVIKNKKERKVETSVNENAGNVGVIDLT